MPKSDSFRSVSVPLRIHAGPDTLEKIAEEVDRQRATRAFIVCGQSVAHHTNLLDRTTDALGDRLAGVFDGVQAGSPIPSVEKAAAMAAAANADVIVALGGGSAVVTTRAMIVLLGEGGQAQDHATKYPPGKPPVSPRLLKPKIPNIVVLTTPTTAMTRAGTAVIDPDTGHRVEFFDPKTASWSAMRLPCVVPSGHAYVLSNGNIAVFGGTAYKVRNMRNGITSISGYSSRPAPDSNPFGGAESALHTQQL